MYRSLDVQCHLLNSFTYKPISFFPLLLPFFLLSPPLFLIPTCGSPLRVFTVNGGLSIRGETRDTSWIVYADAQVHDVARIRIDNWTKSNQGGSRCEWPMRWCIAAASRIMERYRAGSARIRWLPFGYPANVRRDYDHRARWFLCHLSYVHVIQPSPAPTVSETTISRYKLFRLMRRDADSR